MTGAPLPAPTGGWNARDSLAEMPANDAIKLINIVPTGEACRTRPGSQRHSLTCTTAVQTLVTYHGDTDVLIAGANNKLYDVGAGGAPSDMTGGTITNDKWQTTEFKNRIILCNGDDLVRDYDGSSWSLTSVYGPNMVTNGTFDIATGWTSGTGWVIDAVTNYRADKTAGTGSTLSQTPAVALVNTQTYIVTFTITNYSAGSVAIDLGGGTAGTSRSADGTYVETITAGAGTDINIVADAAFAGAVDTIVVGITSEDLIQPVTHKGRVYYVKKDSSSFFYAAASSYAGELGEVDLSLNTTTGGDLLYMVSWTRDSGAGVDDMAVFVMSTGELLVYSGSDPANAADWALLGSFQTGAPLGRRAYMAAGGDVILMTVDGYVPLSSVITEGRYTEQSNYSFKIDPAVKSAAQAYQDNFGWELAFWPEGSLVVANVPISGSQSVQHVRNTTKGAWCKFEGVNASTWAVYDGKLYYGSPDTFVYELSGVSDQGAFISYESLQAFNYFGAPELKKQATAVMPITNSAYPKYIDSRFMVDQNVVSLPTYTAPPEPPASDWDVGEWDAAEWTVSTPGSKTARRNVTGRGYSLAYSMRFKSRAQTVTWYSTQVWLRPAGIV